MKLIKLDVKPHKFPRSCRYDLPIQNTLGKVVGVAVVVKAAEGGELYESANAFDRDNCVIGKVALSANGVSICPSITLDISNLREYGIKPSLTKMMYPVNFAEIKGSLRVVVEETADFIKNDGYTLEIYLKTRRL